MTANDFTLVDLAVIAADRLEGAPVYVLVMQDAVENLPAQTM